MARRRRPRQAERPLADDLATIVDGGWERPERDWMSDRAIVGAARLLRSEPWAKSGAWPLLRDDGVVVWQWGTKPEGFEWPDSVPLPPDYDDDGAPERTPWVKPTPAPLPEGLAGRERMDAEVRRLVAWRDGFTERPPEWEAQQQGLAAARLRMAEIAADCASRNGL